MHVQHAAACPKTWCASDVWPSSWRLCRPAWFPALVCRSLSCLFLLHSLFLHYFFLHSLFLHSLYLSREASHPRCRFACGDAWLGQQAAWWSADYVQWLLTFVAMADFCQAGACGDAVAPCKGVSCPPRLGCWPVAAGLVQGAQNAAPTLGQPRWMQMSTQAVMQLQPMTFRAPATYSAGTSGGWPIRHRRRIQQQRSLGCCQAVRMKRQAQGGEPAQCIPCAFVWSDGPIPILGLPFWMHCAVD